MSVPNTPQFFPYTTEYMDWDSWNGNLAIQYSQEPIMFQPEENWKLVAQHMVSLPIFEIFPLSDPEDFDNWQDWAKDFTMIVNRKSVNMTPISSNMAIWWNNSNTAVPWTNDSLTTVPWTE